MVNIEINGRQIQAREGAMVIEAADEAGITIPRFCYHKKLSIAANCRMCLVEVEKAAKPLPACATPVTEGMRVFTKSSKAIAAQKGVMEFLLINHPLDCPICDQGGECELQEMAMGYGQDVSRYSEGKRVVKDKNIGPLISTDMTRCIHCTRCVRFGQEIAGIMELGATGRGEHMEIGTYVEKAVGSELSGNVIDLCPVGALTSKPFRYTARPWELTEVDGVAAHDCVGSNILIETRRNQVMRVLPRENESVNETWISDRDRFSYPGLASDERLRAPMIKDNGTWRETDWETALHFMVDGIKKVVGEHGAEQIGVLASPNATLEEAYLLQKLMRAQGCANLDHRLRQSDFSDQDIAPAFPWLGQPIVDLEQTDAALLIGSNIRKEQPIVAHRLRKAAMRSAKLVFVNPVDYAFNFPVAETLVGTPAAMVRSLAGIAKSLLHITGASAPQGLAELLENVESNDTHLAVAEHLRGAARSSVLLGSLALSMPHLADMRALAGLIAELAGAKFGYLSDGANAAGAALAGMLPHRGPAAKAASKTGRDAGAMFDEGLKGYVLFNLEPEYDTANPAAAVAALTGAEFVAMLTPYATDAMKAYADVLLPVTPFSETSGTFVNAEGLWQSFSGAVQPLGDARPGWKVLRVLGNLFDVQGFDYLSAEEVRDELRKQAGGVHPSSASPWRCPNALPADVEGLMRIGSVPIYSVDAVVRRSEPLQRTADGQAVAAYLNESTAGRLGLRDVEQVAVTQNGNRTVLPLVLDGGVPDNCVVVPAATEATRELGTSFGPVELAGA